MGKASSISGPAAVLAIVRAAGKPRRMKSLFLLVCFLVVTLTISEGIVADQTCPWDDPSCQADATAKEASPCGLYMAESSIPNAGWGMYTGVARQEGETLYPLDLAVQVADFQYHLSFANEKRKAPLPKWLMNEYYWEASVTKGQWDAENIDSVLPGFGMLANSHVGLVNAENGGPLVRAPGARDTPHAGATTHYHDLTFTANKALPAGHEIFVEYGDGWFRHRHAVFGSNLPLSTDFQAADRILNGWRNLVKNDVSSTLAHDLYNVVTAMPLSPRIQSALPKSAEHADVVSTTNGTAYSTVPHVVRSPEWLLHNGYCLDNIRVADSPLSGKGAFAARTVRAGTIVAPAPLIHMSREHMNMVWADAGRQVLWEGQQLLVNYCYGHPASSLLLFPYSPAVNLINHGTNGTANVRLQWSDRMAKPEFLTKTTQEVLEYSSKAGLMMEIVALRDIGAGEEILLDYGSRFDRAWRHHVQQWRDPLHAVNHQRASDYDAMEELYTVDDAEYPGAHIDVRCWVDVESLGEDDAEMGAESIGTDANGWYEFRELSSTELENSIPCRLVANQGKEDAELEKLYRVEIEHDDGSILKVKNVPWSMITYVETPYTGNQFLREAFRHSIDLPDDLVPMQWRDLDTTTDNDFCGLFMAESAIPNSGLGMYTARALEKKDQVFYGDVVVQVEDFELNMKLGRWYDGDFEHDDDEASWLLDNYYWNPANTNGEFDAMDLQSIVPGLGMLANSHPGLLNIDMKMPPIAADLHRGLHPGAGASTNYHNLAFTARQDITAYSELFVEYGDTWFKDRQDDIGPIPYFYEWKLADKLISDFGLRSVTVKNDDERARLWQSLIQNFTQNKRMVVALPNTVEDVERVLEQNVTAAQYSLPARQRSMEWLMTHGRFLDNIESKVSNNVGAGRGAFATRDIMEGDVIAPMPVIHVRRKHMKIYDSEDHDDSTAAVWEDGEQLLLNYCYGHPDSSLLLFPYSPVVNYVNHNAIDANADLRWSKLPNHRTTWLDKTPDDLDVMDHAGLIMEMVATRDIQAGEEIYLHYGDRWHRSWEQYKEEWNPSEEDKAYVPAKVLNDRVEWLRLESELANDPYESDDVLSVCFIGSLQPKRVKKMDDEKVSTEIETKAWKYEPDIFDETGNAFGCDLLERQYVDDNIELDTATRDSVQPVEITYTAMVYLPRNRQLRVTGIPRRAIQFYNAQYTADQYLRSAFRHEIELPDEMVPAAWRDLI